MGAVATGQGSNSANVRLFNERVILTALRRLGEASKADLARYARLTNNTAGQIVKELEAERLIQVGGKRVNGGRGQPATMLRLDSTGAYAIGVQIGRHAMEALLVDFAGGVIARSRQARSFPLPEEAIASVTAAVALLRRRLPPEADQRLAGLGVATAYTMGSWRRELGITAEGWEAWNEVDLETPLRQRTGLPVFVENDGTAAAAGELFGGRGREIGDFLYVFIGAATGGGVVLGGDYCRGPGGNAGDVGLMPTTASRLASAPRPSGPFEIVLTRASTTSLRRHLAAAGYPVADQGALDRALAERPAALAEWLDDCADALVLPILSAVRLLDVRHVVLDGDLPRDLLHELVELLGTRLEAASPESRAAPALLVGEVGPEAGAFGAAILPLHMNFSPNREVLIGAA